MIFTVEDKHYNVIINRKNNKNTYLRVDEDLNLIINTNYFTTKNKLKKFLIENYITIVKMIESQIKKNIKKVNFLYLGKKYDIVFDEKVKNIVFDGDKIFVANEKKLNLWVKSEMKKLYLERLKYNFEKFDENIPFPNLKIRTMKTRWGVCNIKTRTITLNSLLFKESIDKLDYVVIHELCHLIHFNHSKNFWNLVFKYCPNYKQIRSELKE